MEDFPRQYAALDAAMAAFGEGFELHRGHLLNRPYSNDDQPAPESRPLVTALLFDPADR